MRFPAMAAKPVSVPNSEIDARESALTKKVSIAASVANSGFSVSSAAVVAAAIVDVLAVVVVVAVAVAVVAIAVVAVAVVAVVVTFNDYLNCCTVLF